MENLGQLNPLAGQTWGAILAEYPDWKQYFGTRSASDLAVSVPAPHGSTAGHLVVFTSEGEDLWFGYAPRNMCYALDDCQEMLRVIRLLLADRVLFAVINVGDQWVESTLIRVGEDPELKENEEAQVLSWSGSHDRTVKRASGSTI
jgi:hypothetical protein